jgi:hypothetical protein
MNILREYLGVQPHATRPIRSPSRLRTARKDWNQDDFLLGQADVWGIDEGVRHADIPHLSYVVSVQFLRSSILYPAWL